MVIFKKILSFFDKHFWFFLVLVVLISYGQILLMYVYRDDNALFFKLNNIEGPAGYLGRGIWGDGSYRFQVTPYWILYRIFGSESVVPYYALNLIFYFLSTLSVYVLFSNLVSKRAGRVAGFLFAAGFVASEGFNWIITSMMSNVSTILACLTLISYHKYTINRSVLRFLMTLILYFLTSYLVPSRTHYFIFVVVLFDILIVLRKFELKEIVGSLFRVGSLTTVFYLLFVKGGDKRSFETINYVGSILSGKLYYLYSFFGTIGSLFIPDQQLGLQAILQHPNWILLASMLVSVVLLRKIRLILVFNIINLVWFFVSTKISGAAQVFSFQGSTGFVYLGGYILELILFISSTLDENRRRLLLFISSWLVINVYVYSSLDPATIYDPTVRYMVHSFIPLVGILALSFTVNSNNILRKASAVLVISWGLINLLNSVVSERNIVLKRSIPVRNFYTELKQLMPKIEKGDVVYFDVASNAREYFDSAFRVGQMPEETALAWRYGLDRYDFYRVTEFSSLIKLIDENKIPLSKVHSFFYSSNTSPTGGLIDTTDDTRSLLSKGLVSSALELPLKDSITSITPIEVQMEIMAKPANPLVLEYPLIINSRLKVNHIFTNNALRKKAFEYNSYKVDLRRYLAIKTDSEWRENISKNMFDGDNTTAWQPDRFKWGEEKKTEVILDLKNVVDINRLIWVNAFENNTPIEYSIHVSLDGLNYKEVKNINLVKRISNHEPQVVIFDSQPARFVKMRITDTINQDSPGISEIWVAPTQFADLDIKDAEEFLKDPFGYVPDSVSYTSTLVGSNYTGMITLSWLTDSTQNWQSGKISQIAVRYDGVKRIYKFVIPASGTKLLGIKLTDIKLPGEINTGNVYLRHLKLEEVLSFDKYGSY